MLAGLNLTEASMLSLQTAFPVAAPAVPLALRFV